MLTHAQQFMWGRVLTAAQKQKSIQYIDKNSRQLL